VIARILRRLRAYWSHLRSAILLGWYKSLYTGLRVGRGVRLGRGVHLAVARGATLTIGDNVAIERDCQLVSEGTLSIGPDSFVGAGSIIVAAERVAIGRDVLIAAYVVIRDQDHGMGGALPYWRQPLVTAPVEIGQNVWIGTKASVLRGVTVGDGAVIGAHALVTAAVQPATVVGGIPARTLKRLERDTLS
jgi:acetyltransferase-like isoleucine patch superfamily enzyme